MDTPEPSGGSYIHSRANTARRPQKAAKGYQVHIYPESHHLTAGIPNEVTGLLVHNGEPQAIELRSESLGLDTVTKPLGTFRFNITPHIKPKPIEFSVGNAPAIKSELPVRAQPTQLRLRAESGFFLEGRTRLDYAVDTLPFKRPIHIDTWVGNALVGIKTTLAIRGHHEASLTLPVPAGVPVTVVAFRNIIVPDSNASRTFWPGSSSSASDRAAARQWLEQQSGADVLKSSAFDAHRDNPRWLSLLASRYAPDIISAQLLHSTIDERKDAFDAYRVELRGRSISSSRQPAS